MSTTQRQAAEKGIIRELAQLGPVIVDRPFSRAEFLKLAERYPDLQLEREKNGNILITTPVKTGSGRRESKISFFINLWNYETKKGETFSASTGIELPDGSIKSPDCAWMTEERFAQLSAEEIEGEFLKLIPDFVAEVRSKSDKPARLKRKMTDTWIRHGVRLAWLIDPFTEKAYIYRQNGSVDVIDGFAGRYLSGEEVMPGLALPLDELRLAGKE